MRSAGPILLAFASACTGYLNGDGSQGSPAAPSTGGSTSGETPGPGQSPATIAAQGCSDPNVRGSARESVRRLTKGELVATLRELLGAPLVDKAASALAQMPEETLLRSSKDLQPLHSQPFFDGYQRVVDSLASAIATSSEERTRLGGSCFATDPLPTDCATSFIASFGRRAYRRPLEQAESAALLASLSSFGQGGAPASDQVYGLLFQMLQAPDVLFHIESGVSDTPARIRLTDHEVASRIAYSVLGGPPDAELGAAADAGQLGSLDAVKAQVARLMQTQGARARFQEFFHGWLNMSDISRPSPAVGTWAGIDVDGMDEEIRDELQDYLRFMVWEKRGDFRSLMTDTSVFPRSQRMAQVYGVSPVAVGAPPAQSASHPGLALRAGMIATSSIRTSIIRRGVFVLRRLLCDPIETPPTEIINSREDQVRGIEPSSMPNHEFVALETNAPGCMVCHQKINPVGFVFESFDQLGRARSIEAALDEAGMVVAEHALPAGPFQLPLDLTAPIPLPDAASLSQLIAESDDARACLAANLILHVERRQLEASDCSGPDVFDQLKGGQSLLDAISTSVANDDIFWRRPQ
jgi:hypothetical protein